MTDPKPSEIPLHVVELRANNILALYLAAATAFESRHPRTPPTPEEKAAAERAVAQAMKVLGVKPEDNN